MIIVFSIQGCESQRHPLVGKQNATRSGSMRGGKWIFGFAVHWLAQRKLSSWCTVHRAVWWCAVRAVWVTSVSVGQAAWAAVVRFLKRVLYDEKDDSDSMELCCNGRVFFVCATYQTHLLCLIFNPPLVWVFWLDNGERSKTIQGENSSSGRSAPDVSLRGYFAEAHWIVTRERVGGILRDRMKWQNGWPEVAMRC
jgi:hypothetical protein